MIPPLKFDATSSTGPIRSGDALSGGGSVVFGSGQPGLTSVGLSLFSNPVVLIGIAVAGLVALYIWKKR